VTAFFVRVAAEADRLDRALQKLASDVTQRGVPATARVFRDVAALLAKLAFDAAKDQLGDRPFDRVADDTHLAYQTCMGAAQGLRDAMLILEAREAERCALSLKTLNLDTLTVTQPIDPEGGKDEG